MSDNVGRRPDGPGWYWYEGPYVDDGYEIVDDGQPVPVEVVMSPWKHRENEVLFTGSSTAQKLSHLPGDFVPFSPPVADVSQLSDGYHTFAELYEHRHTLFAALLYAYAPLAFKTRRNQDGEEWPGWFIAGMDTPMGQLSYHMPDEWWDRLPNIAEVERNSGYDGHTSADVLRRIQQLQDIYEVGLPLYRNPRVSGNRDDLPLTKPVAAPEPTWDDAPEWATGHQYGASGDGIWTAPGRSELSGMRLPLGVDWRTTLRKRPEVGNDK